ncbi:hypothetical protein EYZ11_006134 [Aspergillus tanneri]|uniref:Uncharacterized protein n=1 Tax=Aspergillus tanneri TaxID=1220188 RepID=A0A4S3JG86_9EURO|nr:hypothetical protein EYZ11_006134 [Aspergillus tanneri]
MATSDAMKFVWGHWVFLLAEGTGVAELEANDCAHDRISEMAPTYQQLGGETDFGEIYCVVNSCENLLDDSFLRRGDRQILGNGISTMILFRP